MTVPSSVHSVARTRAGKDPDSRSGPGRSGGSSSPHFAGTRRMILQNAESGVEGQTLHAGSRLGLPAAQVTIDTPNVEEMRLHFSA